ncbi:MAG: hypothetical protein ACREL1_07045 [bacterium]
MRKPDDEMKIDIAELFGGDLTPERKAVEEIQAASESQDPMSAPQSVAADENYRAWLDAREKELAEKTQELDRRLQELAEQKRLLDQAVVAPPAEISAEELAAPSPSAPAQPSSAPETLRLSEIDFDQPIQAPFIQTAPASSVDDQLIPERSSDPEEDLKRVQREYEFLLNYDEFRNIILHEIRDLVGEKKAFKMLERTVELCREKNPDIFRNANWDASGNLLQDGSLDSQRLVENKNVIAPMKADAVLDAGLSQLLSLRLQAIEKGLGAGMKNKVRARLYQWINDKVEKTVHAGKDAGDLNRLKSLLV